MTKYRVKREPVVQPLDKSIRLIPLTKGQVTAVDAADYDFLMQWSWTALWSPAGRCFYAVRRGFIYMHTALTNNPQTDHISRDTLDNRRANLRCATSSKNGANRIKQRNNTTGFKGVFRNGSGWMAKIAVNGTQIYLGQFHSPTEAALAYNKAAVKHFGEFARLNHLPVSDI
jgi:hypothetical protein